MQTFLTDSSDRVLHVNPPTYGETMGLSGAIRDAQLRECLCPDVYRALARIGGASGSLCRAVLVCVDRMDAEQFTFFELISRRYSKLPVFVYARPHAEEKINRAVELGGIRISDPEFLISALSIHDAPGTSSDEELAAPAIERQHEDSFPQVIDSQPLIDDPVGDQLIEELDQAEAVEFHDEEHIAPGEEEESVVRVPWLQYEDGPQRIPPSRSRLDDVEPPLGESLLSDESSKRTSEPTPPLLSTEELQALIGKPNDPLDHGPGGPGVRGS